MHFKRVLKAVLHSKTHKTSGEIHPAKCPKMTLQKMARFGKAHKEARSNRDQKTNADLEHGPPLKGGPLRKTNQAKQGQDNGTL